MVKVTNLILRIYCGKQINTKVSREYLYVVLWHCTHAVSDDVPFKALLYFVHSFLLQVKRTIRTVPRHIAIQYVELAVFFMTQSVPNLRGKKKILYT